MDQRKLYIGIVDYYATGEGRSTWIAFCLGKNEIEAKRDFYKQFPSIDPFYRDNLIITDNASDDCLSEWQDVVERMYDWLKDEIDCGPRFKVYFNMNCS